MKKGMKTFLWIAIPTVAAAGLFAFLIKRSSKPDPNGPGPVADAIGPTAPTRTTSVSSNPEFPLKQGSNNEYVGKLQTALKLVPPDNIFGPVTEKALKDFAGITVVKDKAELDAIIKKATTGAATTTTTSRAVELLTKFKLGGYAIYGQVTSAWNEVSEDAFGALQPTGMKITVYKGTTYSSKFRLVGSTKLGKLIMEVTEGAAKGTYTGDPNTISLVKSAAQETLILPLAL